MNVGDQVLAANTSLKDHGDSAVWEVPVLDIRTHRRVACLEIDPDTGMVVQFRSERE
jgi:hypothetical protein